MFEALHPRRPGGRVAVWIVAAIALPRRSRPASARFSLGRPSDRGTLGDLQAVAEFSGTIVGFALLVTAWGMRRGYRLAYVTAVLLVALSGAHGIVQFERCRSARRSLGRWTHRPRRHKRAVHALEYPRRDADRCVPVYHRRPLLRNRRSVRAQKRVRRVTTIVDAVYFTIVTASTVGYGDVTRAPKRRVCSLSRWSSSDRRPWPPRSAACSDPRSIPTSPEPVARQRLVSIPTLPQPDTVRRPAQKSSFSGPMRRSHRSSTPSRPARRSRS